MADTFLIKGLAGKKTLKGTVEINGAKNAVLKAMAASVLFKDRVHIKNVPDTEDVKRMAELMSIAGVNVLPGKKKDVTISTKPLFSTDLDTEISKAMRSSIVITGPLLARYGKVSFPAPGGCVIGARPIDLFIDGYEKMGAKVELKGGRYIITAPQVESKKGAASSRPSGGKLHGAEIFFNVQTVTGTETLMMAAVLAKGKTILKNCAMEPEIQSLARYLVSCGAKIKGIGTTRMEIEGGKLLESKGKPYITIPDRIETGSFLLLGALCAENLLISKCDPSTLECVISMLRDSGVPIEIGKDFIRVASDGSIKGSNGASGTSSGGIKNSDLKSFSVRTHEYPGFPTDLQSPLVTYLTQVGGESIVFETIYEGRFKFTQDLTKMGANIVAMNPREILVKGDTTLKALSVPGEQLQAYDLRAGFAIVMAALVAKGDSSISNVYFIDRGYENLEGRWSAIGAEIMPVKDTPGAVTKI